MKPFRETTVLMTLSAVLFFFSSISAAVPPLLSFQGRATDVGGNPLNGNYALTFRIYDAANGGNLIWSETQAVVAITDGLFAVLLGTVTPLTSSVAAAPNRFLSVQVDADPELTPRRQIVSGAFALRSLDADSVTWTGIKSLPAGFADGVDNNSGGDITAVNTSGGLTGGVASGDANIAIANGGVSSTHIGDGQIVDADVNAAANIAATKISGTAATLAGSQVFSGDNAFNGLVEFGDSTMRINSTGMTIGRDVLPTTTSLIETRRNYNTSAARYGLTTWLNNAGTGNLYGTYTQVAATTLGDAGAGQTIGSYVISESDNANRYGVYSACYAQDRALSAGLSYGVRGFGYDGAEAYGVYGSASSSTVGYGVYGLASGNSNTSYGVFGEAQLDVTVGGVFGYAHDGNNNGFGVSGQASNNDLHGYAVFGFANANAGNGYGVYGHASANNGSDWAGYFSGDVNVTGTIFTPVNITRIDHPLDPENKALKLSGVASPEMTSMLNGNVTTDADGEATVVVPDYFTAISTDYKYQLTVVGQFAQAIIGQKIAGDRFTIRTDQPHVEVSWQVIATRNDKFAQANRTQVESAKARHEIGRYYHPQAHGLGEDRGVDYPTQLRLLELQQAAAQRSERFAAPASEADALRK